MKTFFVAGVLVLLLLTVALASGQVLNVDTSGNVTQAGNLTIQNPGTALLIDLSNSNCAGAGCMTANEFLQFGWDATNSAFQITTKATGTGTGRNIEITPSGSSTSYVANTSGGFTNGKWTVGSSGIFTLYDNVTTAGIGTAAVVGVTDLTNQSASFTATNIVPSTPAAGHYEIRYYADITSACTTGSATWTFVFSWSDATSARTLTTALNVGTSLSATSYIEGVIPLYAQNGSAISVTETRSPVCGSGTPHFDIHADVVWTV